MDKKIIKLFVCLLFLAGCSSSNGLVTSFEDITTESQSEGWFKIKQSKVISVPGLLPFADVGSVQFYKSKRNPSTAIGLTNGNSYILEAVVDDYDNNDDRMTKLIDIKNKITEIPNLIDIFVENKIYLSEIKIKTLNLEKEVTKYKTELEKQQNKKNPTPEEKSLFLEEKKIILENQKLLTELEFEYKKNYGNYIQIKKNLNKALIEVNESINKNGILVYRWNTASKKNGSLNAGEIGNISLENSKNYNGIALISGLRVATLYLGDDFDWKEDQWWINRWRQFSSRFQLTTYVVQAKYIVYISESNLQNYLNAKLKLSSENFPEQIKDLDKLEVAATLSKLQNLSNIGIIKGVERKRIPVNWDNINNSENISLQSLDGWHTFYSVQSDLRQIINMLEEKKKMQQ